MPDVLPANLGLDPQTMQHLAAMGISTGGQLISLLSLLAHRQEQPALEQMPAPRQQIPPPQQQARMANRQPMPEKRDPNAWRYPKELQDMAPMEQPTWPEPQKPMPRNMKLNQNEAPYPMSPEVIQALRDNSTSYAGWDDGRE